MRRPIILVVILLSILFSCKKNNDSPVMAEGSLDPAYLIKTETDYAIDTSTGVMSETSIWKWTYDGQNRPLSYVESQAGVAYESGLYTYSLQKDRIVYEFNRGGQNGLTLTTFHHTPGRIDSVLRTQYSTVVTGSPRLVRDTSIEYHFHDGNGNDVLDTTIYLTPTKYVSSVIQSVFSGNSLISKTVFIQNNFKWIVWVYQGGNLTSDTTYSADGSGVLGTSSYTYLPILSRGFIVQNYSTNLKATSTYRDFERGEVRNETISYTFDSANRVASMTYSTSGKESGKVVYTYY